MRNKKGFTLVELVIVIAVIAILAGVMIGTFASVVKKAKESAKMQEMTAAKQEQIANDIDQKLKNAEWLGWSDFEDKLADAMAETFQKANINKDNVKDAVNDAVEKAFAKYASSIGTGSTGLTEEQVKYIVETALSKVSYSGVTAEQVKAIVNNAVSGTSTLTKAQVQAIVDAAQAKNLTLAQVTAAITNATVNLAKEDSVQTKFSEIEKNLTAAIKDLKDSTLTEADIEALLAKYISNGKVSGNYDWYNANATTMAIDADATKAADQLVALSTMAKGGTSFAGKTIELPESKKDAEGKIIAIDLTTTDFQPIMDFDGKLVGKTTKEGDKDVPATTIKVNVAPVWNTFNGRNGKTMMNYVQRLTTGDNRKDAVAYGLVASLNEGGVISNIVVDLDVKMNEPGDKYTYFGGIVGFLNGGTIDNCKVTGTVDAYNRVGGVVGYGLYGTISKVVVEATIKTKVYNGNNQYAEVGGIIGYANSRIGKLTIDGCKVDSTKLSVGDGTDKTRVGQIFGRAEFKKDAEFAGDTNAHFDINVVKCYDGTTLIEKAETSNENTIKISGFGVGLTSDVKVVK